MIAVRTGRPIRVDGHLDEAEWVRAPPFEAFVESYPDEGGPPPVRTIVRMLYDDATLYVGVDCEDPRPERVIRQLGRRDHIPPSDSVAVAIDPSRSRRTGYFFAVNAGGVLEDRLLYDDTEEADDWDAVWDGAAVPTRTGWSAELAIPLSTLHIRPGDRQVWGIYVERKIARTHEVLASVLVPASADAFVSRFGDLEVRGGETLRPPTGFELQPYLASRVMIRPQYSDPSRPRPRLSDPSADVGLDVRVPLTSDLQLVGTVNPDFGQVEADPVLLNLSRFEPFFPEKRPFFLHGLDLFSPLESGSDAPQQLLYTRRIGLASPILGAAKLTGRVGERLQMGVLEAFVLGAGGSGDEVRPDRRIVLHPEQPLHIALQDAYPALSPVAQNFFAATLRREVLDRSAVGGTAVVAAPLGPACTRGDAASDAPPPRCSTIGDVAAGAFWDLRAETGVYATGQLEVSSQLGGPPSRLLDDGTRLHPGDIGAGGWLRLGSPDRQPWRASLLFRYASPRLDLNGAGFQPDSNERTAELDVGYLRTKGPAGLRRLSAGLHLSTSMSADGRALARAEGVRASGKVVTARYHELGCDVGYDDPRYDLREILQSGIAYRRPPSWDAGCTVQTSLHEPRALELGSRLIWIVPSGPLAGGVGWHARVATVLRPTTRLETKASVEFARDVVPGRWLETDGSQLLFGDLASDSVTLAIRQQAMLTRALSVEGYAQLLVAVERYGPYHAATAPPGSVLTLSALRPAAAPAGSPDNAPLQLRLNLVLRWEYSPGSTLFLVYSRTQDDTRAGPTPLPSAVGSFGSGPTMDVLMVKWTVWYSR
jgi:hypothetical protein